MHAKNISNGAKAIATVIVDAIATGNDQVKSQKEVFISVIEELIKPECFFVSYNLNKKITAVVGLETPATKLFNFDKKHIRAKVGFWQSLFIISVLKQLFLEDYTKKIDSKAVLISLVVNNPRAYAKDAMANLIKNVIDKTTFNEYYIEAPSNNADAANTYLSLGFEEYEKIKNRNAKLNFGYYVYFKYNKKVDEK